MTDLVPTVQTIAQGPKAASGDMGSMTQQDVDSAIKADKYIKAAAAIATDGKVRGIRLNKIKPEGI